MYLISTILHEKNIFRKYKIQYLILCPKKENPWSTIEPVIGRAKTNAGTSDPGTSAKWQSRSPND